MSFYLLLLMTFLTSLDPCSASSQDNNGDCSKRTDGFHAIINCNPMYLFCNDGRASEEACPHGLVFDAGQKGCVSENMCNVREQNKTPSLVTEPTLEQSPTPPTNFDGEERIENGTDASVIIYPYYVEIWYATFMWFDYSACGGVALYTEWVLTAAHCVEQFGYIWPREQWYYVYTGVSSTGVGDKKEITEIIIHEQYKENKECEFCHDIALLRVKPKIKAGSIVQKHSGSAENTYKDCVQIGLHHINGTTNMGGLAKNIITVKPDMACENINVAANQPEAYYNSTIMMCGHSRDKWTGVLPASGDSGSPVICHELSGHIVVGVQSHKIKTRDSNRNEYPEIFTRYSAYVDWIDKRIHHRQ